MRTFLRRFAIVAVFAVAVLPISEGVASANSMTPHATSAENLQIELEINPAWIYHEVPAGVQSIDQCIGHSWWCVWTGYNYTGSFYAWNSAYNGVCVPIGAPFDNAVSSLRNAMPGWKADFFVASGCSSFQGGINNVTYTQAITLQGQLTDNALSSFRTHT